jgi:hypothetical protein
MLSSINIIYLIKKFAAEPKMLARGDDKKTLALLASIISASSLAPSTDRSKLI